MLQGSLCKRGKFLVTAPAGGQEKLTKLQTASSTPSAGGGAPVAGMAMSGGSAKRRRTEAPASSCAAFLALPEELRIAIFGLLDPRMRCTVRMVCKEFRGAASCYIRSVQLSAKVLRSRPETTLNNFPNLTRVTVFDVTDGDLGIIAASPIAPAVTHLRAAKSGTQVARRGRNSGASPLLQLPNLVSITVSHAAGRSYPFPRTLRELRFEDGVSCHSANVVYRLTNLTCLRIDVLDMKNPSEAVTSLTGLQRLDICGPLALVPSVVELTLLTHLQLRETRAGPRMMVDAAPGAGAPAPAPLSFALACLTRLHRLVHLGIGPLMPPLEIQLLGSIAAMTTLRSLDLQTCSQAEDSPLETDSATALSQLTALRLSNRSFYPLFLPSFDMERLQDMSLSVGVELDGDGVGALTQATGLTRLELWRMDASVAADELGSTLARMPRLRALSLGSTMYVTQFCSDAVGPLTSLPSLKLSGWGLTSNAEAEVCLGLQNLQQLSLLIPQGPPWGESDRMTLETFLEIAKMSELRTIDVSGNIGILELALRDHVRALLDARRKEMGWPLLELNISP